MGPPITICLSSFCSDAFSCKQQKTRCDQGLKMWTNVAEYTRVYICYLGKTFSRSRHWFSGSLLMNGLARKHKIISEDTTWPEMEHNNTTRFSERFHSQPFILLQERILGSCTPTGKPGIKNCASPLSNPPPNSKRNLFSLMLDERQTVLDWFFVLCILVGQKSLWTGIKISNQFFALGQKIENAYLYCWRSQENRWQNHKMLHPPYSSSSLNSGPPLKEAG